MLNVNITVIVRENVGENFNVIDIDIVIVGENVGENVIVLNVTLLLFNVREKMLLHC
jgi:hypothetical protein